MLDKSAFQPDQNISTKIDAEGIVNGVNISISCANENECERVMRQILKEVTKPGNVRN